MKFLFLDTETTGLQKDTEKFLGDEVIQIGGILTDENLVPLKVFDYLCDTTKVSINKTAEKLHGITIQFLRELVRDIYLEEVIRTKLPDVFTEHNLITVGHNVMFDIEMIRQTVRDCKEKPYFGTEVTPPMIPRTGRYYIDTVPYFMRKTPKGAFRQKLSTIAIKYKDSFEQFLDNTPADIFDTNYNRTHHVAMHNALIDSIYCYVIFKDSLWKTKLL